MSAESPTTPFPLQERFPPVIISYCTKTDNGRGEERMWQIANLLRQNGIASFNGKQVEPGEDWMQKWLGKLPDANVCIAMLSPSYFESGPCKEEIYRATRQNDVVVLPIIFEKPPPLKKGYFGSSDDERERGNFVAQKIGNYLPTPDQGLFQDNWSVNNTELLRQMKKHLSIDSMGPIEHALVGLSMETKGASTASSVSNKRFDQAAAAEAQGLNKPDARGWTKLMHAAYDGELQDARALLEDGAAVNLQANDGLSALMLSAMSGHEQVARALLENGAAVNSQANNGTSALMLSAANGHEQVARALLENGAAVDSQDNNGTSALMLSASNGHEQVARALLEAGAAVNATMNAGATALMLAANGGHLTCAQLLINAGADKNVECSFGTAASLARQNGHTSLCNLLEM